MAKINKELIESMTYVEKICQQLKQPIPKSLTLETIGHTLTDFEWSKFSNRFLTNKMEKNIVRKLDGKLQFFGEHGIEAALLLQNKLPNDNKFLMICDNEAFAALGLYVCFKLEINITELQYKDEKLDIQHVNERALMQKIIDKFIII